MFSSQQSLAKAFRENSWNAVFLYIRQHMINRVIEEKELTLVLLNDHENQIQAIQYKT